MSDDLNTELRFGADTTGAEAGVNRVKRSLKDLGDSANKASKDAGAGIGSIGAGGDKAAKDVERATKTMQNSLQRAIAAFEGGEKGSRQFYESLARQRNVDVNALKPLLDQLDAVKTKSLSAAQASTQVGSSFSGLGVAAGLAARAVAAIGIGASVGEFVKMADASTNVASRLGLVTSSAAELASVQARLFGIAQAARVSFVDLVGTYAQVARSTKDLGVSQTALLGVIQTISQAVTISGGSAASAQAALTQLSQGFASGALRGEELNSILEQTPRLAQALADGLGVGVGKLRELGQAGELTSEKVLGALEKSAASVAAEFGKMAVTVEQASTNAANSALKLVGVLDKITGASSATAGGISRLSAGMDGLAINIERLSGSKGLSDFFFLAFNNERSLNGELEITQKELAGLEARLAKAPSNIYTRSAVVEMREYVKELKEAQARLAALSGQSGPTDPRDQSGFTGRGASYANEAARQAKLRDDANAFRLNQSGVPASYLKDMAELIRLNQAGVIVGKEYTDALKAQQDTLLKKTGAVKGSASAANAEQNAYESLISSINAKIEADKLEMAGGSAMTESQRIRIKLDQDLAAGRVKLSAQNERAVRLALQELSATEASALAAKTLTKATTDAAQSREKYITSLATGLDKIQADIAAQIEATERMGLSKEAIADLDAAKLEMLATDLELQAIKAMDRNLDQQTYDALKAQAQAYRELGIAKKGGAAKEAALDMEKANADAAKKAQEDWGRASEQINSTLTDALMRGFESGKDFAKNMRDTVVNMFKTMVLRPVISAIVNPISQGITGMMGLSGAAQAGQGGNAASTAMSAASMFGAGGLGGSLAAGAGWLTGATTLGGSLSAATSLIAAPGGLMSGLGMMAGALGPIAIGIAALSSLIKKKTAHTGAASTYSEAGGLVSGEHLWGTDGFKGSADYNAGVEQVTGNVAKAIGDTLNATAKAFGKTAGYEISTAFADDTSKDGAWGSLIIKQMGDAVIDWRDTQTSKWAPKEFADGEKGSAEYLAAVAKSARDAIISIGLPEWAERLAKAAPEPKSLDDLNAMMQQISQYPAQLLQQYGTSRDALVQQFAQGLASGDAMSAGQSVADTLVASIQNAIYTNAAGQIFDIVNMGIVTPMLDAIATGASVADALSQATIDKTIERAKAQAQALGELFGNAEFAAAMDQLRTAVGGALGQAGSYIQTMPQTLVATQQIDTAAQDAARAAEEAQKAWQQITDGLLSDQASLQIDLLRAQGREEEALAAERTKAIEGYDAYQIALYDSNQALRDQITELERMAEVSRTLASELPAVLDKFRTPEQRTQAQYSSIAGDLSKVGINVDSGALAAAPMDQIAAAAMAVYNLGTTSDETRLALVRAVSGIKDLRDAALDLQATAARTAATAAGNALGARNNAGSLLDRIDGATGGKGDAYSRMREAELWTALQTASYQQQIELSDELTGLILGRYQVEKDAARQQLDYAKQLKDYVNGLSIGNLSPKTMGEKLAEAGRQYQDTLGLAQAGDKGAQGRLQGASNAYLELARQYYASSADYTAIFESVSGSLSGLGDSLMTDAERQLSVSSASLDELKSLRGVLEGAYATAQQDYLAQQGLLSGQLAALQAIEGGSQLARDIVQGLPALLAAQLQQQSQATAGAIGAELTKPIGIEPAGENLPTTVVTPAPIDWSGYQQGNDALVAEVKALREEVKALREERKAHDQVIVQGTVAVAEEHARRIVDGVGSAVQQGIYQASISKEATYK